MWCSMGMYKHMCQLFSKYTHFDPLGNWSNVLKRVVWVSPSNPFVLSSLLNNSLDVIHGTADQLLNHNTALQRSLTQTEQESSGPPVPSQAGHSLLPKWKPVGTIGLGSKLRSILLRYISLEMDRSTNKTQKGVYCHCCWRCSKTLR